MDDHEINRAGRQSVIRNLDKISCILIVPVLANLLMWVAMVAFPQLERGEWFTNKIFVTLLAIGFVGAVVGVLYTGYVSLWRGRETAEVAACCLLSAIAIAVNIVGVLMLMARVQRL